MDFQEQMQNTFRTKDEVQEEAVRNLMQKIQKEAHRDYEALKRTLLISAEEGRYTVEDGKRVLTASIPPALIVDEYRAIGRTQQWVTMQIVDQSIKAVYDKKTRRQMRPYVFHNIVYFDTRYDAGQKLYMAVLHQLGAADGIQIEMCLQDRQLGTVFSLPHKFYDILKSQTQKYGLAVQGTYRMPLSGEVVSRNTTQGMNKPDIFSYNTFLKELELDEKRFQDENIRIREREKYLTEEKNSYSSDTVPLAVSLLTIGIVVGGFVLAINTGSRLLGSVILLVTAFLGYGIMNEFMK